jgi:hypothetical protein
MSLEVLLRVDRGQNSTDTMQNRIRLNNEERVPLVLVLCQFCFNASCHCTPILSLHPVIFGVTSSGWLCCANLYVLNYF